jgi:hypothetical protein
VDLFECFAGIALSPRAIAIGWTGCYLSISCFGRPLAAPGRETGNLIGPELIQLKGGQR